MTAERKLIEWARGAVGTPFVWGETDCALTALRAVDQMIGTSHADRYRGAWTNQDEAISHFQHEIPSQVLTGLGAVEVSVAHATVGDVLTVPADIWPEQMAVVLGSRSLCADINRGVCLLPSRSFTQAPGARAWRFA